MLVTCHPSHDEHIVRSSCLSHFLLRFIILIIVPYHVFERGKMKFSSRLHSLKQSALYCSWTLANIRLSPTLSFPTTPCTQSEKLKKSTSTISYKGPKVKVCCRARQYHELDGDGDCWVERRIKIKGKEKSYFRSVLTDECCWNEPPNGASFTVFRDELEFYPFLKDFALKPLGKPLWTIQPTSYRKK
jgi:hypothetical protein